MTKLPALPQTYKRLSHLMSDPRAGVSEIAKVISDDPAVAAKVLQMVKRAEYKRRQAPPGVRVSSRAFGRDWRYPITSGY